MDFCFTLSRKKNLKTGGLKIFTFEKLFQKIRKQFQVSSVELTTPGPLYSSGDLLESLESYVTRSKNKHYSTIS